MKIGIISDTHIPKRMKLLPPVVLEIFAGVDLILHAGDILDMEVIEQLDKVASTYAVYGNNDSEEMKTMLPKKRIIEAEGFKIGLVHGDGEKKTTKERAVQEFNDSKVDCIVFGHSHMTYNQVEDGILLFNPGSPVDKRRQKGYSVGKLYISSELKGELIYF